MDYRHEGVAPFGPGAGFTRIDEHTVHIREGACLQTAGLADLCAHLVRILAHYPGVRSLVLDKAVLPADLLQAAASQGLVRQNKVSGQIRVEGADVYQHPYSGLVPAHIPHFPYRHQVHQGIGHPLRPPLPEGVVYRRYIAAIGRILSLHTLDTERHFALFHHWMNQKRVAKFWELEGDADTHQAYLAKLRNDAHTHPLIAYFDDTPFAYFEVYWAKEDRISAYYPAGDYDRGLHVLVGDKNFLGSVYLSVWLIGLMHYAFISEPRCCRLVGEPRTDNAYFIAKLAEYAWVKHKEFDFPHKRAALLSCTRDRFFNSLLQERVCTSV